MSNESPPFPSSSYAKLAALEIGNWWFKARNELIAWILKTKIRDFQDYMEIGCGTGFVLEKVSHEYPNATIYGSEYHEKGLEFAAVRVPGANLIQLDARTMYDSERFDVVSAFDVIEHIDEDELVLKKIFTSLRHNGWIILTVPQHNWLWSASDEYACHKRRYSRKELLNKVREAGFEIKYSTSFVSFLLPLMWLSRKKTLSVDNYNPLDEFSLPIWMNNLLGYVMCLERFFIKLGMRFPLGGSLLVLAKKAV